MFYILEKLFLFIGLSVLVNAGQGASSHKAKNIFVAPLFDPACDGVPPGEVEYRPYPEDCTKFWECTNVTSSLMSCPDGLWFSAVESVCTLPEDSGCNGTLPTTTTPFPIDPACEGVPPGQVDYRPYPGDCTKFWECTSVSSTVLSCPEGLWFSAEDKVCVEPQDSGCNGTIPTTTTPFPIDPACEGVPPGQVDYRPYDGDCTKFWECTSISGTVLSCPDGLWFSAEDKVCVEPQASGCVEIFRGIRRRKLI